MCDDARKHEATWAETEREGLAVLNMEEKTDPKTTDKN